MITRARRSRLNVERLFLGSITAVLLSVIVAPVLIIVVLSFSSGDTLDFPPPGWSLRWYHSVGAMAAEGGSAARLNQSFGTSLAIATTVVILGAVIGIPASYGLVRVRFPGKLLVEQLILLPLVFPVIVLAIALLVMASRYRFDAGFWRIVIGHLVITMPFMVRNCTASLRGISPSFEEAARTLGANRLASFLRVVLPQMRPGILAGMLLVFVISFNEFTISYFLYTPDVLPFPIWLFSKGQQVIDPTLFALSTFVIAIDALLILLLERLVGDRAVLM